MDKLTLEHLAPYLPYDVKVIFIEDVYYGGFNKESYKDKIGDFAYKNGHALSTIGKFYIDKMNDKFIGPHVTHHYTKKLILRPLSDLTKEIEHKGERFIPIDYINGDFAVKIPRKIECNEWVGNANIHFVLAEWITPADLYGLFQILFEWHFNVFGLIDAGLAIDINTLKGGGSCK